MRKFLYILITCSLLVSCNGGISKEKLAEKVKSDINDEFSKRASDNGISYSITSFDLLHKEGKEYSGILKTIENGQEFTYQVDVTVDGDSYMWKIIE